MDITNKRQRVELDNPYWYVDCFGEVLSVELHNLKNSKLYDANNYFRTEREAVNAAKHMKTIFGKFQYMFSKKFRTYD